jgi:CheY-like chemotaxis protein
MGTMKLNNNNNGGAAGSGERYYGLLIKPGSPDGTDARPAPAPPSREDIHQCLFGMDWSRLLPGLTSARRRACPPGRRTNPVTHSNRRQPMLTGARRTIVSQNLVSILLVDDDPEFLNRMGATFRRAGFGLIEADDGGMALELAKLICFDLVITDLTLPDKTGVETLIVFKQFHPQTRILALAGDRAGVAARDYLPIAHSLGVTDTLVKPFTADQLLARVRRLLGLAG